MSGKLSEELRRFHSPTAEKTRRMFLHYLEVDVTDGWKWQSHDPVSARKRLDDLIAKRRRGAPVTTGDRRSTPTPSPLEAG